MNQREITTLSDSIISAQESYCVTVDEAAAILGLKRSQTRAILGEPYNSWLTASGRTQYVYLKEVVERVRQKRAERIAEKQCHKGYRSCYYCRKKFAKKELCDGLCQDCQARKIARNFACHGDCFRHELDMQRLLILKNAVSQLEELGKGY